MVEHPGFGSRLAWLLDRRKLDAHEVADRAESTTEEIRAVLAGKSPRDVLLRRLGPMLGFHAADLFVLANLAVPDDLAPLDATTARWTASTLTDAVRLPQPNATDFSD
ncbi:hypothetical protein ACH4A8_37270 [Streptomyces vietnamensis]|uniref:hypothetical protein n=1 Tax=Streptomyces vietnamensis TaxID=362257 RepID=UPI00379291A6